ncbi:MAG: cytochrome-c oxidase, cbb3-type subunit III [Azoarcus sp.]|jgi:cytochrome c oxidase cbb3-type subunit 3|nr:cytochrome-c oxidase, cbb3-type subunit III [Azoarcus sp.]
MADFISGFWDLYVAGFVAFGLLLCVIVLVANMTQESGAPQVKGHVWDESLREYNNPLPRWWLYLFVGTIVFSIVYLVIYPGFGNRKSTDADTETGLRREYAGEMAAAASLLDKYKAVDLKALAADKDAMATGQRLFLTYCAQCHGSSAKGSSAKKEKNARGYPDLTDNDWIFGGTPEQIKESISEGRAGLMNAFGAKLNSEEIRDVANYALSLSGLSTEPDRAARGKAIFFQEGVYAEKLAGQLACAVCHGPQGKGTPGLGPNLTDDIWLYDNSIETVMEGVTNGRNVDAADHPQRAKPMPMWKSFISEDKVHVLAAYVYSLSNKQ